ncbi:MULTISPECIES: helix-turn-helix domain-containing protein [Acinetobacter]|uniref:Helix-turn-helix transcriptional regulator n=1 Tax=Acinetobacter indicus TaxID=756892 RepID=A0A6C0Y7D6_9GAMM|nr:MULTISPECIES: helix-turn-helix transcriptional regulator [Acinetobacter]QIC72088.1 helix-turn-helix transcriptional regulator [Acinetobacter indicus]QKQ71511.1 XRE family transcriptional regulator [Acinetobacter sp. 10FS3-1]
MTLQELCRSKDLTIEDVADKIDLDANLLKQYVAGNGKPKGWAINAMAELFDVDFFTMEKYFE